MIAKKPKGLGRGLEALLGADAPPAPAAGEGGALPALALEALRAGRYQPRTRMDESSLQELAASIRTPGLMQPVVVRRLPEPAGRVTHEIIAGERRVRAARLAGLDMVPVIERDVPDEQALALALIENVQREDLNPLEEAQAIRRLVDEFAYSHEQAAEAIGRSRSATTNLLRLLQLAAPVQTMLLAGDLDMGHARALLALDGARQVMAAQEVVQRRLSVRETEKLVARQAATPDAVGKATRAARAPEADRDLLRRQERLADALGAPVHLRADRKGRGTLTLSFADAAQFDALLTRLGVTLDAH